MDVPAPILDAARDALPWWVAWGGLLLWPAAAFGAALVGSWAGQMVAFRRFVRAAGAHWTERARHLVAPQALALVCLVLAPFLGIATASRMIGPLTAVPERVLFAAILVLAVLGTLVGSYLVPVRVYAKNRDIPFRAVIRTFVAYWLLLAPHVVVTIAAAVVMPSAWNGLVPAIAVAAMVAYTWLARGGVLTLLRPFGIVTPADDDLVALAGERAAAAGAPVPAVYLLDSWPANALAMPFANTMLVSCTLRAELTREETGSILDHELGHLSEPRRVLLQRLAIGWLVAPLAVALPVTESFGFAAGLAVPLLALLGVLLLRKMPRRMEERADALAARHETHEGTYARALAKIYEFNLTVAVTGRKRPHPDLYDRMTAAGVEPDFARPEPPPRRPPFLAVVALALCLASLPVAAIIARAVVVDRVWDDGGGHEAVLLLTGGQPWVLLDLGRRRREAGDAESATALMDLAREMGAGAPDLLLQIARFHRKAGDPERARSAIERATELARGPGVGRPWLFVRLADEWQRLGAAAQAREWYLAALRDARGELIDDSYFRCELGVIAARLGDDEAARDHLGRATAVAEAADEDDPWLCVRLAFLNDDVGEAALHDAWLARARAAGERDGVTEGVKRYITELAADR